MPSAYCIWHVCIWPAPSDTVPCSCASCWARSGLRTRFAASGPGGVTRWLRNAHRFLVAPVFHERRNAAPEKLRAGVAVRAPARKLATRECACIQMSLCRLAGIARGDLGMVSCDRLGKSEAQRQHSTRALLPRITRSFPGSRRILRRFDSEGAWVESAQNLGAKCMQHAPDYRCYGRCLCAPLEYHPDGCLSVCCSEGVRHLLLHFLSSHRDGVQALPGEDPRPQRERPCQVCGSG